LALRAVTGLFLAINHGAGKLTSAYEYLVNGTEWQFIETVGQLGFPFPAVFAVCAGLVEFFGGLLLALGLFTRYAAGAVMVTMVVAVIRHLVGDMRYEHAAMFLLVAAYLVIRGPGPLSLDAKRRRISGEMG
jgi:putative oxidoreductase